MTDQDRELFEKALDMLMDAQLHNYALKHKETDDLITAMRERLAQPEPVIDKAAAIRIATVLGWEPPREEQEQEPVVKWDASAPLVVTPHPAFQAALVAEQERKRWHKAGARAIRMAINIEREACAQIADVAEPYQAADLIRARGQA